ncbi:MAG: FGGY family carbohydrate kinase [Armatimonadota bacterium]|nr:FGGY family carbohydrate kinase [Armatimonadota bacterium]MDR7451545.1 FGGY family carbohydrate kinase [Armatimonadota bacterium]MDR7467512.1 FGGY family carbohydrate kinase [Armatimonadota bacterium]MDR7494386.1 FGGY family carbohydrate kinase [Armatimonadota bacterium]MDR7499203.1 FGGY family carbohydrate kinase [Armatimonadota bacterium]
MAQRYLCGVDVGTTATKAVLIDDHGTVLAEAAEPSHLIQPAPGHVEQDLEEMLGETARAVRRCVQEAAVRPADVAAIGFDGQMAGIALIDERFRPVAPYDSWLDTRCGRCVAEMGEAAEQIIALTGGPPSYTHGPKILWWQRERPEVFARTAKVIMPAGYIAGALCGLEAAEAFIDPTYLHFSCFGDPQAGRWSAELLSRFGLPEDKFPRIVQPWAVVGRLTASGASSLGLAEGTPVVAGAGDQAAAMLGAGILRPGIVYDAAGTASVFAPCVPRFSPDLRHRTLLTARLVPEGLWYVIGYINGGGLNLRWFRDLLRAGGETTWGYETLDDRAAGVPPGADGLLFVPHLGGRVCPNRPDLRGAWVGLTWAHGIPHLYRALLEAVAYEYAIYLSVARHLVPELRFEEVRVVGGGAKSALWNQVKADVLQLPYVRLNRTEAAALGTAILAGYGVGIFDDLNDAVSRFTWPEARFTPDPERAAPYRRAAALYESLVAGHDALWQAVAGLAGQ